VLKDLEQIEEVSEQISLWANEFGNKEVTAELVRLYIKEQVSSEAAPGQRRKNTHRPEKSVAAKWEVFNERHRKLSFGRGRDIARCCWDMHDA
jgi:hypothetical protein